MQERPPAMPAEAVLPLLHNHGSAYHEVMAPTKTEPALAATVGISKVTRAEVLYAVREEMAQKLSDVVLRRTDLGTGGNPGEAALEECAQIMAGELGWSEARFQAELAEVRAKYPHFRDEPMPTEELHIRESSLDPAGALSG
jgi:glycerol-3-phosphate dehydrogenase